MAANGLENYPGLGWWIVMQTFRDTENIYRGITEKKVYPFPTEQKPCLSPNHPNPPPNHTAKTPDELSPLDDPVIAKALEIFGAEIEEDMRYKQPEPTERYDGDNNLPPPGVLVPGKPYTPTEAQRVRVPLGLTPKERKQWI
jgi:hypothetical protein